MRCFALGIVLILSAVSYAQTNEIVEAVERKLAAIRYVQALQDKDTGAFKATAEAKGPSLRATSAAIRTLSYHYRKPVKEAVPNAAKTVAFVMSCFDPKTGGFADAPGGKPDIAITGIGVLAALELEIPRDKFAKAMDYLKDNAKTFEDVRIGAAVVEVWGVKNCPFELDFWLKIAKAHGAMSITIDPKDGGAREVGSYAAMMLRLDVQPGGDRERMLIAERLRDGQRDDGGWGKKDEKVSDLETTYRVMRAFYLLKEKPKNAAKLSEFIGKCRNKDGGYGVKPGEPSSASGVYLVAAIGKWLDDMEKK